MKIHHLNGYIQSIYLVEYPHGLLLLDGCCRADVPMLKRFFKDNLKRPLTDLKALVVTHMHPDHAGAAHKLRKLTACQIISAHKESQWYRGMNGLLMHWLDVVLTVYVARRLNKSVKNVWYSRKLKPDVRLTDGAVIPGFPEWQVLETPGHTDRDLSVYHAESQQVYVADLLIKLRHGFICPFPVFHPNKYRRSLQKIADLDSRQVLLAHGGMLTMHAGDFADLIKRAPSKPRTPLRATVSKFKRLMGQSS
ncbi:MBL fold metallo-hydrolase [Marinicella sediminis]|uniref:MBL fold metallo-hydrolase n=1 Tax=Marinicella sediminis TaxID=1792834 RepID=A0ABV7J534_9GAMM|nr:MBL fold metallo-hydrolase [Marinicella sediminis]